MTKSHKSKVEPKHKPDQIVKQINLFALYYRFLGCM